MTTFKVKLRKSVVEQRMGVLFVRIIHERKVSTVTTKYRLKPKEWDENKEHVIIDSNDMERALELYCLQKALNADIERLDKIISRFEKKEHYCVKDLAEEFAGNRNNYLFFPFMRKRIAQIEAEGRYRTGQIYRGALKVFINFRNGIDIDISHIDRDIIIDFENHLQARGLCRNTTSFYMRILRATYRKALRLRLCEDKQPFREVYMGVDKTLKRAVNENIIEKLIAYETTNNDLMFARDMFLFSFYCRGIAFVDLYNLKRCDISDGKLSYFRSKTKQYMTVTLEGCMYEIIKRYAWDNERLFPFRESNSRSGKHTAALWKFNRQLKIISESLKLKIPLSSYVSRHSWASIAKSKGVSTAVISECLGHSSEQTTRIYLASFAQSHLDRANKVVLGIAKRKIQQGSKICL